MGINENPSLPNSITQYDITWYFDKTLVEYYNPSNEENPSNEDFYYYGTFVNGDYWVIGPVIIIGIDPKSINNSGRAINGSMINPSPADESTFNMDQGYDYAIGTSEAERNTYNEALNVAWGVDSESPLIVSTGSSLISTISKSPVEPLKAIPLTLYISYQSPLSTV